MSWRAGGGVCANANLEGAVVHNYGLLRQSSCYLQAVLTGILADHIEGGSEYFADIIFPKSSLMISGMQL